MANLSLIAASLLLGLVQVNAEPMKNNQSRMRAVEAASDASSETAALLVRCAAADGSAFRKLYDLNSSRLYGVALRITRQPALASDAVHDAFLQVWRNAARFDPERGHADGWLISLVRYRALDIARRQVREQPGLEIPEQVDTDPDALSMMVSGAEGRALRKCLEQIDTPRRSLVILSFIEGLTQSQVAERVGQPLGTVKSTIRRALLSLRSCLEQSTRPASGMLDDTV